MADGTGPTGNAAWLVAHVGRLRVKPTLLKDDRLFLLLVDKPDRTPADDRSLLALVRIERARETMRASRGTIRQAASSAAKADRKARDHQRFLASGLLTMTGLLDPATGQPTWDRAILLGALDALASATITDEQRARWKARGDQLLTKEQG